MRQLLKQKINRRYFPDPHLEKYEDIVLVGLDLSLESLVEAYYFGIFPWPHEGLPMLWCCPQQRGLLDFANFKVSKSFRKFLKQTDFKIRFNEKFNEVIAACAEVPRPGQSGTWITPGIIKAYEDLHRSGFAHSIEVYDSNEHLVGGLYGVCVAGVFAGESMFYKKDNASKLALYACVQHLKSKGHHWMDIQMLTPVTEQFGGYYLKKNDFLKKLNMQNQHYFSNLLESKNHILFPQGAPFSAS